MVVSNTVGVEFCRWCRPRRSFEVSYDSIGYASRVRKALSKNSAIVLLGSRLPISSQYRSSWPIGKLGYIPHAARAVRPGKT